MVEEQAEILTKKLDKPERPVPLKYLSGGQISYNKRPVGLKEYIKQLS